MASRTHGKEDIAVAQTPSYRAFEETEPLLLLTLTNEILKATGLERNDVDFTIAGSCDYLSGLPFAFVSNVDGFGAWPPVYESHLEMDGARTRLEASRFEARAGEASWSVREAILGAETVETAIGRARHAVDAVEVTAGQIIERAKDVFRETEGVTQTRAGRIRMIAEGVFSVLGGRATIKAEEELALMGDKIELG